jgi:hypothetical protein
VNSAPASGAAPPTSRATTPATGPQPSYPSSLRRGTGRVTRSTPPSRAASAAVISSRSSPWKRTTATSSSSASEPRGARSVAAVRRAAGSKAVAAESSALNRSTRCSSAPSSTSPLRPRLTRSIRSPSIRPASPAGWLSPPTPSSASATRPPRDSFAPSPRRSPTRSASTSSGAAAGRQSPDRAQLHQPPGPCPGRRGRTARLRAASARLQQRPQLHRPDQRRARRALPAERSRSPRHSDPGQHGLQRPARDRLQLLRHRLLRYPGEHLLQRADNRVRLSVARAARLNQPRRLDRGRRGRRDAGRFGQPAAAGRSAHRR